MMLSDMGADIVRIDRPGARPPLPIDVAARGRVSISLDLKDTDDRGLCLDAMTKADVVIEGFRPGVMERLGLGPSEVQARNPRIIYGRMTGWGQTGPLAETAGHDINYIALTGALHAIGPAEEPPIPPLNLVGDFGGGALYLAFGIAAALYEREHSGLGQVIDAAMVDGAASMMAVYAGMIATDPHALDRGRFGLSGSAPNYRCYECADGNYVAVGSLEPQFHDLMLTATGRPYDRKRSSVASWKGDTAALADAFRRRTRAEWHSALRDGDACVTPVLSLEEAQAHPHMADRQVFERVDGVAQPAPAPRFSRTPGRIQGPQPTSGAGGRERLRQWGIA
jgi:alpha-methylacyl-CoA racemase